MATKELPGEKEELEKTLEKFRKKRDTARGLKNQFKDNEELYSFYLEREKTYADAVEKIKNRMEQLESVESAEENQS